MASTPITKIAYTYEQAEEHARAIIKEIDSKVKMTVLAKIIGVKYSSLMNFKGQHRSVMPNVVEAILNFAYPDVEHRIEYLYIYDARAKSMVHENLMDPDRYLDKRLQLNKDQQKQLREQIEDPANAYRINTLKDQLNALLKGEKSINQTREETFKLLRQNE